MVDTERDERLRPLFSLSPARWADFPPPDRVDSFGGPVKACWESAPAVTRHGLLAYFINFLKASNTW